MVQRLSLCFSALLLVGIGYGAFLPATADEMERSSSSSTETVVDTKGYAFKYSQRLKNWAEQIDTGITKGWLSADDATKMKARLEELRKLNDSVSSKGYPRADLDDMEKQFTQFNIDLSHASETPAKAVAPSKKTGK